MQTQTSSIKPFLYIQTRPESLAAKMEYDDIRHAAKLPNEDLHWLDLTTSRQVDIDLDNFSGFIIGGSPYNFSDDCSFKSTKQVSVERELINLLEALHIRSLPVFGICYGFGAAVTYHGGVISNLYPEILGPTKIKLAGTANDPILKDVGESLYSVVGHKESCEVIPKNATLLASSLDCPNQLIKIGDCQYFSQFHPELNAQGLKSRMDQYSDKGYFDPKFQGDILAFAQDIDFTFSHKILENFVTLFSQKSTCINC